MDEMVKDVNGQKLKDSVEVRTRWSVYYEQVLNVGVIREAIINVIGYRRMPVLEELNERAISSVLVREAVNEMKLIKAPRLDAFPVDCLRKDCMAVLE